ncbi:Galactosylgalactosylxylosylprotein 3-beta-glucuronosyltransferase 2 [Tupaia chinensis]|uniref:Galactosylgalactosylxylosylprotein 3-beta-glucuronosyltransferase n=1 Tax=Tupaia chinensis TaxID=246437 RepID=L8Y3F6_TUPCH|nr:Galactosylgalactosylxylosylprotein 3-beta-glucuronosyltransferase 2 [Tupaia chinensis]
MKSVLFSRFFILLPWILIVIIMLDVDTRRPAPPLTPRPYFSPYAVGRPQPQPEPPLPTIYAITPTYSRPVQKAELTRLANTFRQVAQLHWILVEDAAARSELVSRFLARAGLPSTHLHVPTPRRYKRPGLPRATEQRNAGLAWLSQRHQHQRAQPGVLFFADDDNTYSLELFQEMRTTRKVSVWPVGLVGGRRYERPLVENGKVVGWYTGWRADRPFAIDMAENVGNVQESACSSQGLTFLMFEMKRFHDMTTKSSNVAFYFLVSHAGELREEPQSLEV